MSPANVEEVTRIAQETGAEVLRGSVRYPSESGTWQVGDADLGEHLGKYCDREVVVINGARRAMGQGPTTDRGRESSRPCGLS